MRYGTGKIISGVMLITLGIIWFIFYPMLIGGMGLGIIIWFGVSASLITIGVILIRIGRKYRTKPLGS
mgnify:CR=1 FL=1|tara:strand:+ start:569 stop:772 length:204 start_codon:yes stop_codon:yes gene_type:complete